MAVAAPLKQIRSASMCSPGFRATSAPETSPTVWPDHSARTSPAAVRSRPAWVRRPPAVVPPRPAPRRRLISPCNLRRPLRAVHSLSITRTSSLSARVLRPALMFCSANSPASAEAGGDSQRQRFWRVFDSRAGFLDRDLRHQPGGGHAGMEHQRLRRCERTVHPGRYERSSPSAGGRACVDYISPLQVNVQVPGNLGTGSQPLVVATAAGASAAFQVTVDATAPPAACGIEFQSQRDPIRSRTVCRRRLRSPRPARWPA